MLMAFGGARGRRNGNCSVHEFYTKEDESNPARRKCVRASSSIGFFFLVVRQWLA
jgi:hypothetical protein